MNSRDIKRVLIISYPADIHARAVAWAIKAKGHVAVEFFYPDFPTRVSLSMRPSSKSGTTASIWGSAEDGADVSGQFDTVWLRRVSEPWLPSTMHPGDREIARRHCARALQDFIVRLDHSRMLWVNHFERQSTASSKIYQLQMALEAGLTIPETLVSNDPQEVKDFIARCGGSAIHKVLEPATWRLADSNERFVCYTSAITCDKLPPDEILRLCPGIYQPLVSKNFEVRVTCFGDYLVALRIDSQSDARAHMDWRAGQWYVEMKSYDLPEDIAEKVRRFLRLTGLSFACLDFIVKPTGEHVFLEANPQGQFLWFEVRAGIPVLDVMSKYLIGESNDFDPKAASTNVAWEHFWDQWEGGLKNTLEKHAVTNESVAVSECI